VLSHLRPEDLPHFQASDKALHGTGFFVLASLLWLTLRGFGKSLPTCLIAPIVNLAVYGALDELTQPYFNRTADIHDWLSDMLGALVAVGAWTLLAAARTTLGRLARGGDKS
jgi:VanZ family protein